LFFAFFLALICHLLTHLHKLVSFKPKKQAVEFAITFTLPCGLFLDTLSFVEVRTDNKKISMCNISRSGIRRRCEKLFSVTINLTISIYVNAWKALSYEILL